MAEEGWTGVDRWITSNENSAINEQSVRLTNKGKCSAFGEAVVASGRAQWDLTIEFESFGGISIGIYRQDLRNRDNINVLPVEETFTYTPDGYGYANKTGAFTFNKERKKYGQRYRHGDKITIKLDLTARTLHFSINDVDQGIAYENLPKGAYRLACCMQFKEQKVSITRFWTSLGRNASVPKTESTKTQTAAKDKIGKEHEKDEEEVIVSSQSSSKAKEIYAEYKEPVIDPDAEMFGDDYNSEPDEDEESDYVPEESDDEQPENNNNDNNEDEDEQKNRQSKLYTQSSLVMDEEELKILNDLEAHRPQNSNHSLESISEHILEQHGQKLDEQLDALQNLPEEDEDDEEQNENELSVSTPNNISDLDAVGLIGGRSRGLSKAENYAPEPLNIESVDEDATDFFSLSGSHLKADRSSVTCTRQSNGGEGHSAFGTQYVSNGRIEWMIKIESGHSIKIGVCGTTTDCTDRDFTSTKYGYGYGDDGNIYFGGSHIEYHDGFKAGDIIGVYLNMDMNTLKFSVNGVDHGEAFDSIDLNEKDDINGYRLAVSLQHRPHKLTLLESTLYNVERRSPRPNNNTFGNGGGHQRKLSYSTMNQNNKSSRKNTATSASSSTGSDDAKSDELGAPKVAVSAAKKKKKSSKKSLDSNLSPSKIKKKGKKSDKSSSKNDAASKKKKKSSKNGDAAKKKKKSNKDKLSASSKKKGANKSKTKSSKNLGAASSKSKKKSTKKTGAKKKKNEDEKKENDVSKKKKSSKKVVSSSDNTQWTKRESAKKDKWDECGPKLLIEKSSVCTKTNIKDGNSSFGKLSAKGNKMKIEWIVTVKHGDNIAIGICNVVGGLKTNKNKRLLTQSFTNDIGGYGYMGNDGGIQRSGRYKKYGKKFKAGDKVKILLDTKAKTLSFGLNGEDQGVAFKNLPSGEFRLAASFFEKSQKIILNKTTIWDAAK